MTKKNSGFACLSLSGGMDSSSLLLRLLREGYTVSAISFYYGQKQRAEIGCASQLVQYLQERNWPVAHHIIDLDSLGHLLFSALTDASVAIPEGHYNEENMHATVVPNRNKIFISILQSIALSIATKEKRRCLIALGIHAGDKQVYPDCRQAFIDADYQAYLQGNWQADLVRNYLPYLSLDKQGILEDGLLSCEQLNLDFDAVYQRTLTSYNPNAAGISDYKCASSVQRITAFMNLGKVDPIAYANENGVVDWDTVVAYVKSLSSSRFPC